MKPNTLIRLLFVAIPVLSVRCALAMDMRFDVATDNSSSNDTDWFGASQLTNLNFPTAGGHNIEQGNSSHNSTITAAGNTLGIYYDSFSPTLFSSSTPAQAATTVKNWIKSNFGSYDTGAWLVLNEVDSSTWNGSSGNAYRTWLEGTLSALHNAGYANIILYAESSLASKTYASAWQSIAQYAYIGDETYIDGPVVQADNYSVSTLQATYQASYNAWTSASSGAGLSAASVIAGEHFSVNQYAPSTYWGADGLSGAAWQEAIEARDLAIHNIPFGGFIGYAWDKDAQATGNPAVDLANQEAYEKAYASTMVVGTEVPGWTGNDGSTSWADYLNWTGGLPSTTSAPYPLLASTNPNLPKQTSANFLTAITANTTITLDGNQSITDLNFGGNYSYTIAPGTGGTLTITGPYASMSMTGTAAHYITAPLVISAPVTSEVTGSLTLSGGLTNTGYTIYKGSGGTLTISGAQNNAPNSGIEVDSGTLNLNSDAGSSSAQTLTLNVDNATANLNAGQHLAALSMSSNASVALKTNGHSIFTRSLTEDSTSTLDLTDNDLIDDYTGSSPVSTIQAAINSGYNKGSWNGKGIITSAAASHAYTTLGVAEASQVLGLTGSETGTFDGQTVDATTALVKFTWIGDANLDGVVNASDLALMQMGGTTWAQGDFNHDGVVNAADYALYYQALAATGGQNISTITPEPAVAWLLLIPFTNRRCRRRLRLSAAS